jgi:hypothetical protein
MLTFNFSIDNINKETARRAFCATSFSPEKRGEYYRKGYVEHMQNVQEEFAAWVTEENAAEMSADLESYRLKYIKLFNAYLYAHSRVMSPMITGPAKFPTRSNKKKGDTADRRRNELLEWSKKRLDKLRRKYNPRLIASAPILAGQDDALQKLRDKLAKLESYQEAMKKCNKLLRSKEFKSLEVYDEKVTFLTQRLGWKEETAYAVLEPDYMGKIGIPAYQLKNNNAEIRRLKGRIIELERLSKMEATSEERPDGIEIERDPDAARIRLIFPGKPDKATRTLLKQNGFRWAPSVGAWQRQLNRNGEYAVKNVLAKIDQWQGV